MSCCGLNNGCNCNTCQGVRLNQFAELPRVASNTQFVVSSNNTVAMSTIEAYLLLKILGYNGSTFNNDADTESLGNTWLYACIDTTAPRTLTISDTTIGLGSPTAPYPINVNDESGGAGANNITVVCESGQLLDGAASQVISVDYGTLRLYSNGTGVFSL